MASLVGRFSGKAGAKRRRQRGQAVVEYALTLAVISVMCVAVLGGFGEHIRGVFLSIISSLAAAGHGF